MKLLERLRRDRLGWFARWRRWGPRVALMPAAHPPSANSSEHLEEHLGLLRSPAAPHRAAATHRACGGGPLSQRVRVGLCLLSFVLLALQALQPASPAAANLLLPTALPTDNAHTYTPYTYTPYTYTPTHARRHIHAHTHTPPAFARLCLPLHSLGSRLLCASCGCASDASPHAPEASPRAPDASPHVPPFRQVALFVTTRGDPRHLASTLDAWRGTALGEQRDHNDWDPNDSFIGDSFALGGALGGSLGGALDGALGGALGGALLYGAHFVNATTLTSSSKETVSLIPSPSVIKSQSVSASAAGFSFGASARSITPGDVRERGGGIRNGLSNGVLNGASTGHSPNGDNASTRMGGGPKQCARGVGNFPRSRILIIHEQHLQAKSHLAHSDPFGPFGPIRTHSDPFGPYATPHSASISPDAF